MARSSWQSQSPGVYLPRKRRCPGSGRPRPAPLPDKSDTGQGSDAAAL